MRQRKISHIGLLLSSAALCSALVGGPREKDELRVAPAVPRLSSIAGIADGQSNSSILVRPFRIETGHLSPASDGETNIDPPAAMTVEKPEPRSAMWLPSVTVGTANDKDDFDTDVGFRLAELALAEPKSIEISEIETGLARVPEDTATGSQAPLPPLKEARFVEPVDVLSKGPMDDKARSIKSWRTIPIESLANVQPSSEAIPVVTMPEQSVLNAPSFPKLVEGTTKPKPATAEDTLPETAVKASVFPDLRIVSLPFASSAATDTPTAALPKIQQNVSKAQFAVRDVAQGALREGDRQERDAPKKAIAPTMRTEATTRLAQSRPRPDRTTIPPAVSAIPVKPDKFRTSAPLATVDAKAFGSLSTLAPLAPSRNGKVDIEQIAPARPLAYVDQITPISRQERMAVRMDGEQIGAVQFQVLKDRTISVHLGQILDLFESKFEEERFARLRSAPSSQKFVTLERLSDAEIQVRYDAVYDELVISS